MTHTSITPEMIEAALEAYMPFGDMGLAIQCALAAAPQPPEAAEQCQSCRTGSQYACTCPFKTHRNSDASCFGASQAQRVPLSDAEIRDLYSEEVCWDMVAPYVIAFARSIEAAHGIQQRST